MLPESLPPELERLISVEMSAGQFNGPIETIAAGLRLLRERREHIEQLKQEVQLGLDQLERGECRDFDRSSLRSFFQSLQERARNAAENIEPGS